MSEGELLEDLADRLGCYISSLRDPLAQKIVFRALLETEPGRYSVPQWEYTVSYLVGTPVIFQDQCEICRFLEEKAFGNSPEDGTRNF